MLRLVIALALLPVAVGSAAHPGHDPVALVGTLTRAFADRIDVETYDTSAMQKRTITVMTGEATKWRLGKKPVKPGELPIGTAVVITFEHAELKNGADGLMAIEIRGREIDKKK